MGTLEENFAALRKFAMWHSIPAEPLKWISEIDSALRTALAERDDARRAQVRMAFGSGNTAVVHNLAEGIRCTKCYSHHEVAVIWWGDNEADRLYPGEQ